jgi:hypothetical protein
MLWARGTATLGHAIAVLELLEQRGRHSVYRVTRQGWHHEPPARHALYPGSWSGKMSEGAITSPA